MPAAMCRFNLGLATFALRVDVSFLLSSSDNAFGRILVFGQGGNPNNTIQSCVIACASQNFTIAGTEFGGIWGLIISLW